MANVVYLNISSKLIYISDQRARKNKIKIASIKREMKKIKEVHIFEHDGVVN